MCDVVEKKPTVGLWAARSRQRCVGVHQPEAEVDQLGPSTPVVPERAEAEGLGSEHLDKYLATSSRCVCCLLQRVVVVEVFGKALVCASVWTLRRMFAGIVGDF